MRIAAAGFIVLALTAGMAGCQLLPGGAHKSAPGNTRYYTWVDSQGHLQSQQIAGEPALASHTPAAGKVADSAHGGADTAKGVQPAAVDPADKVFAPDDAYVDSTVLESHHFNMDGKKRFGVVAEANGRSFPVDFPDPSATRQPETLPPPIDAALATPSFPADNDWPVKGPCCADQVNALGVPEALKVNHSYWVQLPGGDCRQGVVCEGVVLALPTKRKEGYALRLVSFLSNLKCKRCMQWPEVIILDRNYQPLRAVTAGLTGYDSGSYMTYGSFHMDIMIEPSEDAFVYLPSTAAELSFNNRQYKAGDRGEIAFAVMARDKL